MKPKILIFSYWYAPFQASGTVRVTALADYLESQGWEVLVLSVKNSPYAFDGLRLEKTNTLKNVRRVSGFSWAATIRHLMRGRIKASRGSVPPNKNNSKSSIKSFLHGLYENKLCYPDECWPWYLSGRRSALKIARDFEPDCIFSSALPASSHLMASYVSQRINKPWVAEFRDLWSRNYPSFKSESTMKRLEKLEQKVLAPASSLVTVSQSLADTLQSLHPSNAINVVLNGFKEGDHPKKNLLQNQQLVLSFTGMLYPEAQDLKLFIELIKELKKRSINHQKISFNFYGPNSDIIHQLASKHSVQEYIENGGNVKHHECLQLQVNSDALFMFSFKKQGILTGKLFEYLGAHRPLLILGPRDPKIVEVVEESQSGYAMNDVQESADLLENWIKQKQSKQELDFKPNCKRLEYTREAQFSKLEKILISSIDNYEK